MTVDLNLPAFGLDCRDWLVATEAEGLLVEPNYEAPIVAVLSTAVVVGHELVSARAVLSLALLDDDDPDNAEAHVDGLGSDGFESGPLDGGLRDAGLLDAGVLGAGPRGAGVASAHDEIAHDLFRDVIAAQDICVLEAEWSEGYARFAVPAPGGELAVVAEFSSAPNPSPELIDRFYDLVTSFRWAA